MCKIWYVLFCDSYIVSGVKNNMIQEVWLNQFLKHCLQLFQQLPMSAFANRFPTSHKQSHHIQNIFSVFTIPELIQLETTCNSCKKALHWLCWYNTCLLMKACHGTSIVVQTWQRWLWNAFCFTHDTVNLFRPSLLNGSQYTSIQRTKSQRVTWYLTYYNALHSWYMQFRTSLDNYPLGLCFLAETQLRFR